MCQTIERHQDALNSAVNRAYEIATGVHLARDLGNESSNNLYPDVFFFATSLVQPRECGEFASLLSESCAIVFERRCREDLGKLFLIKIV